MGTEPGLGDPSVLAAVTMFNPGNCIIMNSAKLKQQGHTGVTELGSGIGSGSSWLQWPFYQHNDGCGC